eukprot:CAMPEP_0206008356 /NCGR_PEP_ID=MMETSP1464-20131121/7302_1 /ASSEMBLY_ACC=CAM_ASM_001124 /TAXON_ID=119497 /ORGANISM="Exanthemachrysis gayraliae, Strain RCC1523" /LENGTH=38 /DNA_ID= /DNA_START= /DNA_END= /DNA_ORIENTATION=
MRAQAPAERCASDVARAPQHCVGSMDGCAEAAPPAAAR